jgi:peptidoglycan/LPS O-acetylase OafA/YrhL
LGYVRPLDGLRGIAVLLVVLFHLGLRPFRSGYLGVDIFFVISGFLITNLLIAEVGRTGRISLPAFWARRARRLLPALALMLVVVAVVGWFTSTFSERASLRGDLLATVTYVANWHFIKTTSYFVSNGIPSPVEHTWSLAIEEQFYLAWPLLVSAILVVWRRSLRVLGTLTIVGIVVSATLLAMLWLPGSVERAYMGTDARIFEPLMGALGAILLTWVAVRDLMARHGSAIGILGALGVLAVILVTGPGGRGYYFGGAFLLSALTLVVVASVWVNPGGPLGRSLGWRPLAWVGVISYGVYLWHWPITLWLNARDTGATYLLARRVLAFVMTIGVAAASFYAMESRIRRGSRRVPRAGTRPRLALLERDRNVLVGIPLLLLLVACVSVEATNVPPPSAGAVVVMVTGDSVPKHLIVPLESATQDSGWRFVDAATGACPATGEMPVSGSGGNWTVPADCRTEVVPKQEALLKRTHPNIVLWWDRYSISNFESFNDELVVSGTPRFWQLRRQALDAAVQRLSAGGAIVVFVATEPVGPGIDMSRAWHQFEVDHYFDTTVKWDTMMRRYAKRHPTIAAYISITSAVCHAPLASPCNDTINGRTARPDGQHYKGAGITVAVNALVARLAPIVQRLRRPSS